MSDNEDYFYCRSDDYYSDDDYSYLFSPPQRNTIPAERQPPVPTLMIEPGEGSTPATTKAADEKVKPLPVEEMKENSTSFAIIPESKEEGKDENQNETKSEGKRAVNDADSEVLPAQKKAKTI